MSVLVFVYGTLKRGGRYHDRLRNATYFGTHSSEPQYTMLDLGPFPGVVDGGVTAIKGEVYSVDNPTLSKLDQLEDHPNSYVRTLIDTRYGRAWIYLYQATDGSEPVVSNGDWPVGETNKHPQY